MKNKAQLLKERSQLRFDGISGSISAVTKKNGKRCYRTSLEYRGQRFVLPISTWRQAWQLLLCAEQKIDSSRPTVFELLIWLDAFHAGSLPNLVP